MFQLTNWFALWLSQESQDIGLFLLPCSYRKAENYSSRILLCSGLSVSVWLLPISRKSNLTPYLRNLLLKIHLGNLNYFRTVLQKAIYLKMGIQFAFRSSVYNRTKLRFVQLHPMRKHMDNRRLKAELNGTWGIDSTTLDNWCRDWRKYY